MATTNTTKGKKGNGSTVELRADDAELAIYSAWESTTTTDRHGDVDTLEYGRMTIHDSGRQYAIAISWHHDASYPWQSRATVSVWNGGDALGWAVVASRLPAEVGPFAAGRVPLLLLAARVLA